MSALGRRTGAREHSGVLFPTALAFLALPAVSALLPALNMTEAKIDIHVACVVFLALTSPGIRGACCAFVIGWLADLFTGIPTGVPLCATMTAFVALRLFTLSMSGRSLASFVVLSALMGLFYGLICRLLAHLGDMPPSPSLTGIFLSALLLIPASALIYPLLSAAEDFGRTGGSRFSRRR